jgi:hypothetical protein
MDDCGCEGCRNLVLLRDGLYPGDVLALLEELGVDPRKEAEAYHTARLGPNRHLYSWCLHAVGRLVDGDDCQVEVSRTPTSVVHRTELTPVAIDFKLGFSTNLAFLPESFLRLPVVQIECSAVLPWVLPGVPEPDR